MARWHGGGGRPLHPQASPRGPQASLFISLISICSSTPPVNSYLHINGFIHRDIKAANLLIDDDGTVLLGDLGVAAPLNDEDHTHLNDRAMAFRAVIFDPNVEPVPRHSRVGKRRSFVGTVGLFPWKPRYHTTLITLSAVLDGARTHFGHPIRLVRRYLVLRHHSPRVGSGACPSITRILSYTPFSHVSPLPSHVPDPWVPVIMIHQFWADLQSWGRSFLYRTRSDRHLPTAWKPRHLLSIVKVACTNILALSRKSWSVAS